MVDLSLEIFECYPHELSRRQQQRVGIAIAIASDPKVIIYDGPLQASEVSVQAQTTGLFPELCQKTAALSYQDSSMLRSICDCAASRIRVKLQKQLIRKNFFDPSNRYTKFILSALPDREYRHSKRKEAYA